MQKEMRVKQKIISTYQFMMKRPFDTSLKIYKCKLCFKKFVSRQYLQSHLEKAHKHSLEDESSHTYEYSAAGMQTMERDILKDTMMTGGSNDRIEKLLSSYQEQSRTAVEKIDALYEHFSQEISILKNRDQVSRISESRPPPPVQQERSQLKSSKVKEEEVREVVVNPEINVNVDLKPCFEEIRLMLQQIQPPREVEIQGIIEKTVKAQINDLKTGMRKQNASTAVKVERPQPPSENPSMTKQIIGPEGRRALFSEQRSEEETPPEKTNKLQLEGTAEFNRSGVNKSGVKNFMNILDKEFMSDEDDEDEEAFKAGLDDDI